MKKIASSEKLNKIGCCERGSVASHIWLDSFPSGLRHTRILQSAQKQKKLFPSKIILLNRQRRVRLDWQSIEKLAYAALPLVRKAARPTAEIWSIECIEVTVVSERIISGIHHDFCNDPSPTDVITFPTGEILLGAETIITNAHTYKLAPADEFLLCIIHGLLHLAGWQDLSTPHFQAMKKQQEKILSFILQPAAE